MSAKQRLDKAVGEQRAETVTSQQPGDATTGAATRNTVAEERRQWVLELTHCFIKNWIYDN